MEKNEDFFFLGEKMTYRLTWTAVMADASIINVQEPISEMFVTKEEFDDAYSPFMITLDGRDCTTKLCQGVNVPPP